MNNPERDNARADTASPLGNDPSGIAARLLRLAQQLEDQHAPDHMTILLREASSRLFDHLTETLEMLGHIGQLSDEIERLRKSVNQIDVDKTATQE